MSPWVRTTVVLAVIVGLVGAADVAVRVLGPTAVEELPVLPAVKLSTVRRIKLITGDKTVELERIGETGKWNLIAPVQGPADSAAARDLVSLLRRDTPMQVQIDTGNLEEYGLQSGVATRLQIFQNDTTEPTIDLYVGRDTVGGASFVRFPDDDSVYRAQIGGAHRIKRQAREWKDRQIFTVDPNTVRAFGLTLGDGQNLRFVQVEGQWTLPAAPDFPVDQQTVVDVLNRVTSKRAGQVLPGDFPLEGPPLLSLRFEFEADPSIDMQIWQADGVGYVKRTGRDEVFQVAEGWARQLALPRVAWLDRQLVTAERANIRRMVFHDPNQGDLIMEQDVAMGGWTMIQPPNVDANLREANQAAIKLAGMRAEGIADRTPEQAGFPARIWIELQMVDGTKRRIELGNRVPNADPPLVFVRTVDQPERIGVLPLQTLFEIRKAFGQ